MFGLLAALLLVPPIAMKAAEPLSVSGIYPPLTTFDSSPTRERTAPEYGLGAVVPRAGTLWSMTYTSYALGKGKDKLLSPGEPHNGPALEGEPAP